MGLLSFRAQGGVPLAHLSLFVGNLLWGCKTWVQEVLQQWSHNFLVFTSTSRFPSLWPIMRLKKRRGFVPTAKWISMGPHSPYLWVFFTSKQLPEDSCIHSFSSNFKIQQYLGKNRVLDYLAWMTPPILVILPCLYNQIFLLKSRGGGCETHVITHHMFRDIYKC